MRDVGETSGIDYGGDGGLAFGGRQGAIAVGHYALHGGRAQQRLASIVDGIQRSRVVEEDQDLAGGEADL